MTGCFFNYFFKLTLNESPSWYDLYMSGYLNNHIEEQRNKLNGMTQKELGSRLGVADSVISRYESGELAPPYDKILKMASLFRISPEALMGSEIKREYVYTDVGERIVSLARGQVVRDEIMSGTNEVSVKISPDGVIFSTACVRKWADTNYIHLLILEEERLLVIRKCDEDDPDSRKWSMDRKDKVIPRKLTGRDFATLVYELMNWSKGYSHKIKGIPGVDADDHSSKLWVFELADARATPLSRKTRLRSGVTDDDIDKTTLQRLDEIEQEKAAEKEERKRLRDRGEILGPAKKYIYKPDRWGQYMFGPPLEEYTKVREVKLRT